MVKRKAQEHLTLYSLRPAITEIERLVEYTLAPFGKLGSQRIVVTIQPAGNRRASKANGWAAPGYRAKSGDALQPFWSTGEGEPVTEINLVAENMRRPVLDIYETVIHECAHIRAFSEEVKVTSAGGYYHNKKWIPFAESVGLEITGLDTDGKPLVKSIGYGQTKLSEALRTKLVDDFHVNEAAFLVFRNLINRPKADPPARFQCTAQCQDSIIGYITTETRDAFNGICGICMQPLLLQPNKI